jgi:aryl-alcohol dehydrogenase-like predicted oxidoreductase
MRYTKLGKSGLKVSQVAFGTWELGGDWGGTDEQPAISAIRRAADEGVTLFDTAQGYGFGASERLLATALAGYPRDQIVIATKGGLRPEAGGVARDASADWIRHGVDDSLRALDTDHIDLFQLHWPDPKTPFEETAGALSDLVSEGKIHHVGVSNFDVAQMEAFSALLPVETLQPPYHLFRRDVERAVLPYAANHNIGVLVYGPLAHGLLSGGLRDDTVFAPGDWRASSPVFHGQAFHRNLDVVTELGSLANELGLSLSQLAIAWVLANPEVDTAIVGTRNPAHVDQAVAATEIDLEPSAIKRIEEITAKGVPVDGPSPEVMPQG